MWNLHHRHVTSSVNPPPIKGPATIPICETPNRIPVYMGLLLFSTLAAMMVRAPLNMPLTPNPAIALPTMNTADEGATPQIREPTSKRKTKDRKTGFVEKCVYSLPDSGCRVAAPRV
jgi:hypothetical protein